MYARMLEKATFTDRRSLEEEANRLPVMRKLPLHVWTDGHNTGSEERLYASRQAIYNTKTKNVIGDVDESFYLLQHGELTSRIAQHLDALGLPYKGSVRISDDGSYVTGLVAFGSDLDEPQITSDRDHEVGHTFWSAIEWRNALDTSGVAEMNGVAVRKVCRNGRVSREHLGSIRAKHTASAITTFMGQIPQFIVDSVAKSGAYERLWMEADQEQVAMNMVPIILKGVGLPERGLLDVVSNINTYEPRTREHLSRATLHEAASYWLNHVANIDMRRNQAVQEKIHVLLDTNLESLLQKVTA